MENNMQFFTCLLIVYN